MTITNRRKVRRSVAKAGFSSWLPSAALGDAPRLPTVDRKRAVSAHELEGLVATVTDVTSSYVANVAWFRLRARRIGTGTEVETPWTHTFNVRGAGELSAVLVRHYVSLCIDYGGEAWLYATKNAVTPIVGGTVAVLLAKDDETNADGSPAFVAGYELRDEAGKVLAQFDRDGRPAMVASRGQLVAAGPTDARLVRVWHPHPGNPAKADSRVLRAGLAIDILHRARMYTKTVMERGAGKREVAYIKGENFSDTQLSTLERRLTSHAKSTLGGLQVVPAEVEIAEVGATPIGGEVSKLTEDQVRALLDVWVMPPSMLGRGGDRTYENQHVEIVQWLRTLVVPRLHLLAAAIPTDDGIEHYIDASGCPLFGEDYAESAERGHMMWLDDAITLGEYRHLAGLTPLDEDDERAGMYRSELMPAPAVVPPFPEETADDLDDEDEVDPEPEPAERSDRLARSDSLAHDLEGVAAEASGPFAAYAQHTHARIASMAVGAVRRRAGVERADDTSPAVPPELTAEDLVDATARTREVATDLVGVYDTLADTLAVGHAAAAERAGLVELAARMVPEGSPAHLRYVEAIATQRTRLIAGDGFYSGWIDGVRDDVEDALTLAKARGESVDQLAQRIYEILDVDPDDVKAVGRRAETIARTESMGLSNAVAEAQWRDSGLVQRKRWYTIGDQRTRASHKALSGKEVAFDADFEVGGYPAKRPHDPRLPASETINCRCRLIPVV